MAEFDPAVESFTVLVNRHSLKIYVKLIMVPGCLRNVYIVHGLSDAVAPGNIHAGRAQPGGMAAGSSAEYAGAHCRRWSRYFDTTQAAAAAAWRYPK